MTGPARKWERRLTGSESGVRRIWARIRQISSRRVDPAHAHRVESTVFTAQSPMKSSLIGVSPNYEVCAGSCAGYPPRASCRIRRGASSSPALRARQLPNCCCQRLGRRALACLRQFGNVDAFEGAQFLQSIFHYCTRVTGNARQQLVHLGVLLVFVLALCRIGLKGR